MAAALARSLSAEVLVARVTDSHETLPAGAAGMARALTQADQESACEYLERVARDLTRWGLRGTTRVRSGHPVRQIARLAREERVDLIVIASHGRTGATRWLLGSVAEGVLRHAPCPVLLCRGRLAREFHGFERVIVPLDGSNSSARALQRVQPFLAHSAQVTLVRATDALVRHSALDTQEESYQAYLAAIEAELDALDPEKRYARKVLNRTPAQAILDVAEESEADLIAMVTHGRKGLDRALIGSVTERVARHALCPVMVFPTRVPRPGSDALTGASRGVLIL
jgi:nucleotide-binding universal stress UspA family protein